MPTVSFSHALLPLDVSYPADLFPVASIPIKHPHDGTGKGHHNEKNLLVIADVAEKCLQRIAKDEPLSDGMTGSVSDWRNRLTGPYPAVIYHAKAVETVWLSR